MKKKKNPKIIKYSVAQGLKTLDKEANLNATTFDLQHQVDPLFKKKTQKFDGLNMSMLMSSTLNVTPNLLLPLDSEMDRKCQEKD